MEHIELKFADDENGAPVRVPTSAAAILVMKHRSGQPGAPAKLHRGGKLFKVTPDAPADALGMLAADSYRCQPEDKNGKRIGTAFYIEIMHLDDGPADEANEPTQARAAFDEERERFYQEMRQERQELRALVKETVTVLRQFAERALETQVEFAKAMPKAMEASATMLAAARGSGLSDVANEVREIMEAAPDSSSSLETVLSSPVVVGAAAALQKYMAQAAQNGAEAMVSGNGERRESMAQRAARIAAEANNRAMRS